MGLKKKGGIYMKANVVMVSQNDINIGIAVNKEKETSRDIIISLEEVIDENIKKFNQIFKGGL